ncbi:MAG: hypothetical protein RLY78_2888 [Pseudomonadota bacterium]
MSLSVRLVLLFLLGLPWVTLLVAGTRQSRRSAGLWLVAGLGSAAVAALLLVPWVPAPGWTMAVLAVLLTGLPLVRAWALAESLPKPPPHRPMVLLLLLAAPLQVLGWTLAAAAGLTGAWALIGLAGPAVAALGVCARIALSGPSGGPRPAALLLVCASGLELVAVLAACAGWPAPAGSGMPAAPVADAGVLAAGLLAVAVLVQLAHLGLLLDQWQVVEQVARERWAVEAERREMAARDTHVWRRSLAEREAVRQRDAWSQLRQQVLDGLDQAVRQPLRSLSEQLSGADGAAAPDPAGAASPPWAESAHALVEALDAWFALAELQEAPASTVAAGPVPQPLDFLLGLALQDLAPEVRSRVRLAPVPEGVQVAIEPNLFRLGLRHLLRQVWRGCGRMATLNLSVELDATRDWVGLCVSWPGESVTEPGRVQPSAQDLDVVARICAVQGGWLARDDGQPARWWLPVAGGGGVPG